MLLERSGGLGKGNERQIRPPRPPRDKVGKMRQGVGAKGTYLLVGDVQLVPSQYHVAVFPNLPENAFPAEFPDPADLLGRCRRMVSLLRPLPRGRRGRAVR